MTVYTIDLDYCGVPNYTRSDCHDETVWSRVCKTAGVTPGAEYDSQAAAEDAARLVAACDPRIQVAVIRGTPADGRVVERIAPDA